MHTQVPTLSTYQATTEGWDLHQPPVQDELTPDPVRASIGGSDMVAGGDTAAPMATGT